MVLAFVSVDTTARYTIVDSETTLIRTSKVITALHMTTGISSNSVMQNSSEARAKALIMERPFDQT